MGKEIQKWSHEFKKEILKKQYANDSDMLKTINNLTKGSHKIIDFKCPKCEILIQNKKYKDIKFCQFCEGTILVFGKNDLETNFPQITAEIDEVKRIEKKLKPASEVFVACADAYPFICPICGCKYEKKIADRTLKGQGCPSCAGRLIKGFNDFATKFPELMSYSLNPSELYETRFDKQKMHRWLLGGKYPFECSVKIFPKLILKEGIIIEFFDVYYDYLNKYYKNNLNSDRLLYNIIMNKEK